MIKPLSDSDFALIKKVDFRLNNLMTALLGQLELALNTGELSVSDHDLQRLQRYLFERSQAIESNQAQFNQSTNADLHELMVSFLQVRNQLMSMAGAIGLYLRNKDLEWFNMSITDAYNNMKPQIEAVRDNTAYQGYKDRIKHEDAEASRTHFSYETSRRGE